jgi:hypothetical protein
MNNPTINTAKRNKKQNHNPLFFASFELINARVILLMMLVLERA